MHNLILQSAATDKIYQMSSLDLPKATNCLFVMIQLYNTSNIIIYPGCYKPGQLRSLCFLLKYQIIVIPVIFTKQRENKKSYSYRKP